MDSPPPSAIPPPAPDSLPAHGTTKFSLRWWCAPIFALFVIVEVIFSWPSLKVRYPDMAGSVLLGKLTGGVIFPLLIAWAFYRLRGRSQRAASMAFSITLLLISLSVIRTSPLGEQFNRPTVTSFGAFRFEVPAGWGSRSSDRAATKAIISRRGGSAEVSSMIQVDLVDVPAFVTPRMFADKLVEAGGRVLDGSVSVDGIEGVRAETSSTDLSRPRVVVVVTRAEGAYIIAGAGVKGDDVSDAFQHVLDTWHWISE